MALLEPWQWNSHLGTCQGDQYFFPPRIVQADCPNQNPLSAGCWVSNTPGVKHDSYFCDETRYFFVYSQTTGISLQFFGDDDLFVYINGILVLDLGGVHQQLPGKVSVTGAQVQRRRRFQKVAVLTQLETSRQPSSGT